MNANIYKQTSLTVKITVLATLLVILVWLTFNLSFAVLVQAAKNTLTSVQTPTVVVEPQSDSPLNISVSQVRMIGATKPEIDFQVTNVGAKAIRAYSILVETKTEKARFVSSLLTNSLSTNKVLLPSMTSSDGFGGSEYLESVKSLTLSIDYVEFADNTTWGKDEQKSAEKLAGQRAGSKIARQHFKGKLKDKNDVEVEGLLAKDFDTEIPTPAGHSDQWATGFRTGVDVTAHRLRKTKIKKGLAAALSTLAQPYDASEGRQENEF